MKASALMSASAPHFGRSSLALNFLEADVQVMHYPVGREGKIWGRKQNQVKEQL